LLSIEDTISLQSLLKKSIVSSIILSNKLSILLIILGFLVKLMVNFYFQESINGYSPKDIGSMYTIPQRETVAGEATDKSSTSNIMVIYGVRVKICPEFKHNFLLSSNTVFILSIQIASTGPSKMTQCFS